MELRPGGVALMPALTAVLAIMAAAGWRLWWMEATRINRLDAWANRRRRLSDEPHIRRAIFYQPEP